MNTRRTLYAANTALIALVLGTLVYLTVTVVDASNSVKQFNEQQVRYVQDQNDLQLCTQHDITIAVRKIGRKLGLPVEDITVPQVQEEHCEELRS